MATQVDKSLPPDITADITKVEPKTTFYKDGEQVALTPEEAKKFQGGTNADPWYGLKQSGWSITKPIVTSDEAGSEIDNTQKKIDEYDTVRNNQTTANNIKLSNQEQAIYDENAKQLSTFDDDYALVSDKLDSLVTAYDSAADTLVQTIKDTYAQRTKEMNLLNKSSLGAVTKGGVRSGRQRYASEINQGILTAEESAGINRIQKLANEEASLIAQAKMAKTEEDWKMFNEKRRALDELNTKKVALLKDQLDIINSSEDRAQVRQSNALEKLKAIAEVGGDISPDLMSQIDSAYGEGFSTKYADVQAAAKASAAETDQVEFAQKVINILNDIPEGIEIPIGDAVYTGMKSPSEDLKVYMEKDGKTGENKIITYNLKTGEVQSTGTGVFGKVGGGGGTSSSDKTYWTAPDDKGEIKYYYGKKGDSNSSQEITSENYLKGKSSAEGVLSPEDDTKEFLSQDYFKNLLTTDQLEKAAVDAGFGDMGEGLFNLKNVDVDGYLKYLDNAVKSYRSAGYNDKEILKMMQ